MILDILLSTCTAVFGYLSPGLCRQCLLPVVYVAITPIVTCILVVYTSDGGGGEGVTAPL